jgi:hypothetical protein
MLSFRSIGRAGALFIPIALAVAACGGATTSTSPGATSGSGSSAAPTSAAATPTPLASSAQASTEPSFPIAIPSFDIGALTQGLENVDSYKISISVKGEEQIKGVVVTKPELARDYTLKDGTRVVVIGDKAWMGQGGGTLASVPGALVTGMFAAFDPTLLVGAFSGPQWAQASQNKGTEQKNGVEATHYHIDSTTAGAGLSGFPAGASVDLWVSADGILVALETTGFPSGDLSIQVTAIDDPANKVETPS